MFSDIIISYATGMMKLTPTSSVFSDLLQTWQQILSVSFIAFSFVALAMPSACVQANFMLTACH